MSYIELSIEERASIQVGLALGMSLKHIAQLLGQPLQRFLLRYAGAG